MKKAAIYLTLLVVVLFSWGRTDASGGFSFATAPGDYDGDGLLDENDNCPEVANPDQNDSNHNGIGDVCEGDWDGDGVPDNSDNCWDVPNPNQDDLDGDGVGDACDRDRDGDGYTNSYETNILKTNPDNWDTDGDHVSDYYDCAKLDASVGVGSDCNSVQIIRNTPPGSPPNPEVSNPFGDDDNDGILNNKDNCPEVFNPGQQDQDQDGKGDLCDNIQKSLLQLSFAEGGGGFGNPSCSLNTTPLPANPSVLFFLMGPLVILRRFKKQT